MVYVLLSVNTVCAPFTKCVTCLIVAIAHLAKATYGRKSLFQSPSKTVAHHGGAVRAAEA